MIMSQSNNREVDLGGMVLHPHKLCVSHQMVDTLLCQNFLFAAVD